MKIIKVLVSVLYFANSMFLKCSQPPQYSLIPTFQWTCHKKNAAEQKLFADQDFANLTTLLRVLSSIAQELPAQNHWTFSSVNYPNLKCVNVTKTDNATNETQSATYMMHIPANNNSHLQTSIWGFHPYTTKEAHIGLTPYTATQISEMLARHNTQASRNLMPIIHCITTATLTYAPQQPITVDPLPRVEEVSGNKHRNDFVMVDPENVTQP